MSRPGSEGNRPDPDELLRILRRRENGKKRGRLKIFLGMAAGVGKTYAMLQSAQELQRRGEKTIIGWVDTHGRPETDALVSGLEVVSRRVIPYRQTFLEEMDLDGILKLPPRRVLVDELAHTNAPGSRHSKRFLDVLELLEAGFDVDTTLNVQHLESRADTVREITGIVVRETVPDTILDEADEIVLVDLAPEALLKRLEEGRVYLGERSRDAMRNFFREGNLTALREMALRATAERVDRQLRDYRHLHGIEPAWKSSSRLMVAVYASPYSEVLIRWTRRLADAMAATWLGVYVASDRPLSADEQRLVDRNLSLVEELGGESQTVVDEDAVHGLLRVARQQNVTQIVVGKSSRAFLRNLARGGSVISKLLKESGNIDIYVVSSQAKRETAGSVNIPRRRPAWSLSELAWVGLVILLLSLILHALLPWMSYRSAGLIFLFAVTIFGLRLSWAAVLTAALLSGVIWDLFFIPPPYTFYISETEDVLMLFMYLIAAGVTGYLTTRLRRNQAALQAEEERMRILYDLSRNLASARALGPMLAAAVRKLQAVFDARVAVLLQNADSRVLQLHPTSTMSIDEKEWSVASWVADNGKPAGLFTDTLSASKGHYLPLIASEGTVGVLGLEPRRGAVFSEEQKVLAEAFAHHIAAGAERELLHQRAKQAEVAAQAEQLYRTLLDSVSHELKTPLTAIQGSASTLLDHAGKAAEGTVKDLAGEIQLSAGRLQRLVENLLNMTRLESGQSRLHLVPCDLSEIMGVALRELDADLNDHPVLLDLAHDLPIIPLDFGLIEQAVTNILHNAALYSPPGNPIEIHAARERDFLVVYIRDHGPGLPREDPEKVFEKFFRSDSAVSGGTGLGLPIARGFIEAHGGTVTARNHPGGGAEFSIRLPIKEIQ